MKNTWMTIKEIIDKTTKKTDLPNTFLINGTPENDPNLIAHELNKYFVEIGPSLASNIQTSHSSTSIGAFLSKEIVSSFHFENVTLNLMQN